MSTESFLSVSCPVAESVSTSVIGCAEDQDAEHQQALAKARRLLGLVRQAPPSIPLEEVVRAGPPPRVVASFGLGVDSTALLTRLVTDPSCRDFGLDELVVITAGTGQEWPRTLDLVSRHMLPLLSAHRVRYIQVARRGPAEADGVDITADSRRPDRLHLVGAWTLAHEMFDGGTVPQTCGDRICSQHFKGFPLDTVIGALTQGRPYRHLMGYANHLCCGFVICPLSTMRSVGTGSAICSRLGGAASSATDPTANTSSAIRSWWKDVKQRERLRPISLRPATGIRICRSNRKRHSI